MRPEAGTAGEKKRLLLSRGRQQTGLLSHQGPEPVCKERTEQSPGRAGTGSPSPRPAKRPLAVLMLKMS